MTPHRSNSAVAQPQPSATIGLRRVPIPPSISTSTTSPGFIHKGGLRGEADPLRRAGRDHVAGHQRRPVGAVRDQSGNVEDQIVDPGVLDLPAVEPRHQMQPRRVGNLVRGDDLRPKPPVAWKFLPAEVECLNRMSRIEPSLKQV